MVKKILVLCPPEDRSLRALSLARGIARRSGAELALIRVLEEGPAHASLPAAKAARERLRALLLQAETEELQGLADAQLGPLGSGFTVRVEWGVTWEVMLEAVRALGIDLVVKPAWGTGHDGRVFFGATALHLFRRCPCPVWVVGDDGRLPTRIVAAIDPAEGAQRRRVAARILRWAQRVGKWSQDAEVHVASAWSAPEVESLRRHLAPEEIEQYVEDARARARRGLGAILDEVAPQQPDALVHLIEGPSREVLPRFSEESGFDLMVIGALGRDGPVGDLLGETAEIVLRSMRSSALVLTPSASRASDASE